MTAHASFRLEDFPLHLGPGGKVAVQPQFTGADWYEGYGLRHGGDGVDGRLVSMHSGSESWTSWEMHPAGEEVVICLAGEMTLHQELTTGVRTVVLRAGDAVVNPAGVWHTADAHGPHTALFITVGLGTEQRSR